MLYVSLFPSNPGGQPSLGFLHRRENRGSVKDMYLILRSLSELGKNKCENVSVLSAGP